ncbi:hypothetical protein K461DRAFT_291444 [Myriangium duriaei CBS 260.36]|uniref:Uncharacterized protein n=1 Tax=Myriangium duriaei CBS 260.36 TaxID=1168546 RepID=A0A9P4MIP6_9PEZI|nr:hypothetical protein K461DRAFT_291444 [Myriangium duriaei CBS 260.36]
MSHPQIGTLYDETSPRHLDHYIHTVLRIRLTDQEKSVLPLVPQLPPKDARLADCRDVMSALLSIQGTTRRANIVIAARAAVNQSLPISWARGGILLWAPLLSALSQVPDQELMWFAQQARSLTMNGDSGDVIGHTIRTLAKVPVNERQEFVNTVVRLQGATTELHWEDRPVFVLGEMGHRERTTFVEQLLRLLPLDDMDFAEGFLAFAEYEYDRATFVTFVEEARRSIFGNDTGVSSMMEVGLLLEVNPEDRAESLVAFARLIELPWDERLDALEQVIDSPVGSRKEFAESIVADFADQDPDNEQPQTMAEAYRQRTDNVMGGRRRRAIDICATSLFATFPDEEIDKLDHNRVLDDVEAYLNDRAYNGTAAEREVFQRKRDDATELENAQRVINGLHGGENLGINLRANPRFHYGGRDIGLGTLTALVWETINNYQSPSTDPVKSEQDKMSMRYSVFRALSQCIEGRHCVCDIGFTARLMGVLQGYVPFIRLDRQVTPQGIVAAYSQAFDISLNGREPEYSELASFYTRTLQEAQAIYPPGSDGYATMEQHLREHFRITYGITYHG